MAALIVLILTAIMGGVLLSGVPNEAKEVCLALYFIGVMAMGERVFRMALKDPRGLAYGPKEYLEESRMARARTLAELEGNGDEER